MYNNSRDKYSQLPKDQLINELEGILEELDESKARHEQSEAGMRRLATVVRDSNDAITVQDLDGTITAWNKGAEKMYGYTLEEALGMNISEIFPEHRKHEARELIDHIRSGKQLDSFETKRLTKDGRILDVWLTLTKLMDDKGNITAIASTERDITERKESERRLRILTEELKQSNEQLEQFAAIVSHDLQSPVISAMSSLKLFLRRFNENPDQVPLEFIYSAMEKLSSMQSLIQRLLEYSRAGSRKDFEPVDAGDALEKTLEILQTEIEEAGAAVTYDKLPVVKSDMILLQQLFQNLISNAVRYRDDKQLSVHVSSEKKDGAWMFSVRDTGSGIASEHIDGIFEMFTRSHTTTSGSGIGLATCRKIVEIHGGSIHTKSEPGKGTTFYFTIPGVDEE